MRELRYNTISSSMISGARRNRRMMKEQHNRAPVNVPPVGTNSTRRRSSFASTASVSSVSNTRNNNGGSNNKKPIRASRRPSHLNEISSKERHLENDDALKQELLRVETAHSSDWTHPIGFNFLSALRILNAPGDPVLNNTGYYIQPEELEDIPAMFDSFLNVNCLYYSLVGVLAIETSLTLPIPEPDAPLYAQWLITVSRFCWCANGIWSMSAVVASFHILWCIYATPTWAKRRFVFDNSKTISVVYAMVSFGYVDVLYPLDEYSFAHILCSIYFRAPQTSE